MSPPWAPFRSRASRGFCSSTPKTPPGSCGGCPPFQRTKNYYRPTKIDACSPPFEWSPELALLGVRGVGAPGWRAFIELLARDAVQLAGEVELPVRRRQADDRSQLRDALRVRGVGGRSAGGGHCDRHTRVQRKCVWARVRTGGSITRELPWRVPWVGTATALVTYCRSMCGRPALLAGKLVLGSN